MIPGRPDVAFVLMDVSMPEIYGFELSRPGVNPLILAFIRPPSIFISAVHLTDLDRGLKGYHPGGGLHSVPVVPELLRAKVRVFRNYP